MSPGIDPSSSRRTMYVVTPPPLAILSSPASSSARLTPLRAGEHQRADVGADAGEPRRAPVTVGFRDLLARRPRHQQRLQHALLDQRHALGRHALVVDTVVAEHRRLAGRDRQQRIVDQRQGRRGDPLPELVRQHALLPAVVAAGRRGLGRRRAAQLIAEQDLHDLRRRRALRTAPRPRPTWRPARDGRPPAPSPSRARPSPSPRTAATPPAPAPRTARSCAASCRRRPACRR